MTVYLIKPALDDTPRASFNTLSEAQAYIKAREHTVPGLRIIKREVKDTQVFPARLRAVA
jgi:hypothetical protein